MSMVELHRVILELTGQNPALVELPDPLAIAVEVQLASGRAADPRSVADAPARQCSRQERAGLEAFGIRPTPLAAVGHEWLGRFPGRQVRRPPNPFDRDQLSRTCPMPILLIAIILGIVEGVTEFIPVSSTGHLILATELLGFDADKWAVFNVIIQLGAILAMIVLYWRTFWAVLEGLLKGQRDVVALRAQHPGRLPAVGVLGFLLINRIEALLGNAIVVAVALILGGIAILVIERLVTPSDIVGVADMPLKALGVGLIQCLAMIPGVSRSGATILGGLSLGVERRTAAEFSFFLAIPTMLGATTLELVKHRDTLMAGASGVGFGTRGRLRRQLPRRHRGRLASSPTSLATASRRSPGTGSSPARCADLADDALSLSGAQPVVSRAHA